jgi:hypothetical protein
VFTSNASPRERPTVPWTSATAGSTRTWTTRLTTLNLLAFPAKHRSRSYATASFKAVLDLVTQTHTLQLLVHILPSPRSAMSIPSHSSGLWLLHRCLLLTRPWTARTLLVPDRPSLFVTLRLNRCSTHRLTPTRSRSRKSLFSKTTGSLTTTLILPEMVILEHQHRQPAAALPTSPAHRP